MQPAQSTDSFDDDDYFEESSSPWILEDWESNLYWGPVNRLRFSFSEKMTTPSKSDWKQINPPKFAIALYQYNASGRFEVSLEIGEKLKLEEETNGWYRGTSLSSSSTKRGLFPANYVKFADTLQELEMDTDVIIMEIQKTFRSWQVELQKTLDEENMQRFAQVRQLIIELVSLRQKVFTKLDDNLKQQIRKKMEEGTKTISSPPAKVAIATMRNHSLTATKHEIQANAEEGIISLYLRHVDQRNKQSEQLRENKRLSVAVTASSSPQQSRAQPLAKVVSQRSLTNMTPPTPSRRNIATRQQMSRLGTPETPESSKYYQILLDMKVFMCSTGESSEIRFSLYNADHKKFITEEFQITLTAHGMPEDVSKIGKIKTVFRDITDTDTTGEVYIVAKLFRKGRILPEMKGKTKKNIDYRRPFGCAMMKLSKVSAKPEEGGIFGDMGVEKEHTIPIYSTENENDIVLLPEHIPKNQNLIQVPHAKGIVVGLTLYHGDYENIPDVRDISVVNKVEFPEVIMPGLQRHDFYVTLESGEFTKTDNIEVGICIKAEDGSTINDCLIVGASHPLQTEFRSSIVSKDPNPVWRETINVKIPESQFSKTHLFFTFRLCSDTTSKDKDFAFAFLPLTTPDGPVVSDSEHVLPLYSLPKAEEGTFYLKQDQSAKLMKLVRKGEQIKVKTLLSSTKLTTDGAMLYLLHWKEMPKQRLPEILNRVTYIHTVEILKFLRELFDSMFAILDSNGMENMGLLVYNAIVFIIGILLDEKRNQNAGIDLRRILDTYISEHFTGAMAHKHLMNCLKQYLDRIDDKSQISKIIATFKALEYTFKFIIKSRLLYTAQGSLKATSEDVWFKKDLLDVFQVFNALMKKSGAEFRGVQANALKNFGYIIPDLGQIFGNKELATIIRDFVGSMSQYDASLKLLNMEKLHVIQTLVSSEFFLENESRAILIPTITSQIDLHMKSSIEEERRECILIINEMIHLYETKLKESNLLQDLLPLLPQIMKAVPTFKQGQGRLDAVTCFLTLFHVMKPEHFDSLLNLVKDDNWTFVMKIFQNFQSFILAPTYPESWLPMNMFQYNIILKVVTELTKYATKQYSSAQNKDQFFGSEEDNPADKFKQVSKLDVWRQFFKLAAFYIQSKTLAGIRWGSEAKQKEINEKCDKLRLGMMRVLRNMWLPIGSNKIKFIQNLIPPFLEFQAINNQEIQKLASELYHNAIEAEWEDKVAPNSFPKVETYTIDALDKLSSKDQGGVSEEFRNFFLSNLEARLKTNPQELQQKGLKFVNDIKYFLGLLTALRTLPDGPEYEDDRTAANLKLMEYLKQTNRRDAYVRYVQKLAQQHESGQNYVEAGEALLLHARLYKWNTEKLGEISGEFPAQTQRERKEALYRRTIELFDKGKMWERACALIKELREEYQFSTYEYDKLGDLLELQATLLKKILTETRFFAEYYRVAFYGKGFDKNVSGKDFIYRGLELEKRDDFIARMKFLFPNAEILPRPDDPTPDIVNGAGQYLQIMPVRPTCKEEMDGQVNKRIHPNMPPALQKYYLVNDVNVFVFSKPFRKTKEKTDNEFKDLWVLNKYYITEESFPTIHRRSQITNTVSVEVSPIETAYRTMKEKNLELQELLIKHNPTKNKTVPAVQEFTMVIKGVIDALVNGGPDKYKDAFFNAQYVQQNPDKKQVIQSLKDELLKQISILESALALHKTRIGPEMADLQSLFEQKFLEMKEKSKTIN